MKITCQDVVVALSYSCCSKTRSESRRGERTESDKRLVWCVREQVGGSV